MKLLFRVFLSLCLFLSSGYSYLHAHRYQDHIGFAPIKFLEGPAYVSHASEGSDFHVKFNPTISEKEDDHLVDTPDNEDDDNDDPSSKKPIALNDYFSSFFPTNASPYTCSYLKTGQLFCTQLSHFASARYILFRVIRV